MQQNTAIQPPSSSDYFFYEMQKSIMGVDNDRDRILYMCACMTTLNLLCKTIELGVSTNDLTFDINEVISFISLQADRTDDALRRAETTKSMAKCGRIGSKNE